MLQFTKAVKYGSKLRMALIGTSGSGKTYSALSIASHLGKKIAFIDTERGSARKYSDKFEFDVIELQSFAIERYLEAIKAAEQAGYDVLIIDSLSHAWSGKDGLLEFVDMEKARSKSGNAFTDGWRKATPLHNSLIDTILGSSMHIITCMRSKTEYVMQEDPRTGKKVPVKIGMQPVQREGMEYEFDVIGDMNMDHNLVVGKTRCAEIDGKVFPFPGKELADILNVWLGGEAAPAPVQVPAPQSPAPSPTPAPAQPEISPELAAARGRVQAQLSKMKAMNLYADWDQVREEMVAVLGVNHLSLVDSIDSLNAYYENLVKRTGSDTPFSSPAQDPTPAPAPTPEPSVEEKPRRTRTTKKCPECGIVDGHHPSCSKFAEMNAPEVSKDPEPTPAPVQEENATKELCQSLLDTLEEEIKHRDVPESISTLYCKEAMEKAEQGKADSIMQFINATKAYPVKPAPVEDNVANLQNKVKELLQKMVTEDIDNFSQSSRLTNSVKLHLEVSKVAECTDAQKLAAYATHLHALIANKTNKENVA